MSAIAGAMGVPRRSDKLLLNCGWVVLILVAVAVGFALINEGVALFRGKGNEAISFEQSVARSTKSEKSATIPRIFGNSYSVNYEMLPPERSADRRHATFRATVTGPSSELKLVLVNPDGKMADIQSLRIAADGCHENQQVLIRDPKPGTWVLVLKNAKTDKPVWQERVELTTEQLATL